MKCIRRLLGGENNSTKTGKIEFGLVGTKVKSVQLGISDHYSSSANKKLKYFKPGLGSIMSREADGMTLIKRRVEILQKNVLRLKAAKLAIMTFMMLHQTSIFIHLRLGNKAALSYLLKMR